MSIYKTAIEKPVTTSLIFVAVIIIGLFALMKLPIDQFPEMEPPYVSVMCTYPGNTGSEIETNLTKMLENSLNSVEGLDEMTSTSKDNIALVTMKFQWGQNMDEVVNDVRSALDMISDNLPDGAGKPMMVWQDFVAGTDPTDENDVFAASVTFDATTGEPIISWTPELSSDEAAKRSYKTYGKVQLTDKEWTLVDGDASGYNFFKVTVEMK